MANKKSIRFFKDREVRAVWSDAESKWYFSATDVVRAINNESDYVKAGNYWRWLKKKLNADGIQLVSDTHDFKFQAPMASNERQMFWMPKAFICWQSIIRIAVQTSFSIGLPIATTQSTARAARKPIRCGRAI